MTEEIKDNAKILSEIVADFLKEQHGLISAHQTNFKYLDLINGLKRNDLIILSARPGVGKTALALNIAINTAKQKKTVLFFSLEASAQQLARRVLSSEAEIDQSRWVDIPFFIDDSSEVSAFDLISKCRIFKRKHNNNLDLVVVDYLQMMKINGNSENRAVGVAENSRMLKVLAKEFQVPVLALAQLSRNVENRHTDGCPQLSDLRDSSSIEQDADMIWFIHRPAKEKQKREAHISF